MSRASRDLTGGVIVTRLSNGLFRLRTRETHAEVYLTASMIEALTTFKEEQTGERRIE